MSLANQQRIDTVLIDGGVLLKIVNHCHSSLPQIVTGQLLGLDVNKKLEVTATFPFLQSEEDGNEDTDRERDEYQFQMLSCLRDVNVDANSVGWYYSSWDEEHLNAATIDTQYHFQKELGSNSVFVVYDPLKTTQGKLWLKAFRLQEKFMPLYENQDFIQETLKADGFQYSMILEEIPVEISNNVLTKIFISELAGSQDQILSSDAPPASITKSPSESRFDLEKSGYLSKGLEGLIDSVDGLLNSYYSYSINYKKYVQAKTKEEERKVVKPSRLETMLCSQAINNHCKYLQDTSSNNFENLFVAQTIAESENTST